MQTLEFNTEELDVLRGVLERGLSEIDVEIFHTDVHDFKQLLKHRREILERLLAKIATTSVSA